MPMQVVVYCWVTDLPKWINILRSISLMSLQHNRTPQRQLISDPLGISGGGGSRNVRSPPQSGSVVLDIGWGLG